MIAQIVQLDLRTLIVHAAASLSPLLAEIVRVGLPTRLFNSADSFS